MAGLRFLRHMDTFAASAHFYKLAPDPWKATAFEEMTDPALRHKTLLLRVHPGHSIDNWLDDLPCADKPAFEKWASLRRLIDRSKKAIFSDPFLREALDPLAPVGRVCISVIPKGGVIGWHIDEGAYAERHLRFHVPLTTNPACGVICLTETVHMAVGALWWMNTRAQHSSTNFGETTRSHLIFELRRREAADVE